MDNLKRALLCLASMTLLIAAAPAAQAWQVVACVSGSCLGADPYHGGDLGCHSVVASGTGATVCPPAGAYLPGGLCDDGHHGYLCGLRCNGTFATLLRPVTGCSP